jgi:hypothetical protein
MRGCLLLDEMVFIAGGKGRWHRGRGGGREMALHSPPRTLLKYSAICARPQSSAYFAHAAMSVRLSIKCCSTQARLLQMASFNGVQRSLLPRERRASKKMRADATATTNACKSRARRSSCVLLMVIADGD